MHATPGLVAWAGLEWRGSGFDLFVTDRARNAPPRRQSPSPKPRFWSPSWRSAGPENGTAFIRLSTVHTDSADCRSETS